MPERIHIWRTGRAGMVSAILLFALAGTAPVRAQTPGMASGEVTGSVVAVESGEPIVGATVTLEPADDGVRGSSSAAAAEARSDDVRRTTTGDRGDYRFTEIPPGRYRLSVSQIGFRPSTLWIDVPASWKIRRSLELEVEPIALRPIDVSVPRMADAGWDAERTARRIHPGTSSFGVQAERTTLDARSLTADDVASGATLGEPDIFRALQRLPGASGQGDFSAALWTRGAPWGLTQIFLDGLPLYDPLHLGGTATGVSSDGLDGVFFMPGVRPAALAEGAAGTVNLVTRRASGGFSGQVSASPVSVRARVQDRFLDERVGVSVNARRSWWDLIDLPSMISANASTGAVDYHFADASGRLDVRLDDRTLFEAGGMWEEDRIDGDIQDLVSASEGSWGNRQVWAALGRSLGVANVRLFYGQSTYDTDTSPRAWAAFRGPNGFPSLTELSIDLSRRALRLESHGEVLEGRLSWQAGLERIRESLLQSGIESHNRQAPGNDIGVETVWARFWSQATLRLGSLRLTAGAALDDLLGDATPSLGVLPTAAVRWQATDRLALEAATGRSRQFAYPVARAGGSFGPALNVGHVWYLAGADRPPITSEISTVGLEARLPLDLRLVANAWIRHMNDLWLSQVATLREGERIDVVGQEADTYGREEGQGLEVTLRRISGRVTGEAGYTYGRSVIQGDEDVSPWLSPADRKHSVDVVARVRVVQELTVGAGFKRETGWPTINGPWVCPPSDDDCQLPQSAGPRGADRFTFGRAPRYESVDLTLDWLHRGESVGLGVRASVHNLLGRDNAAAHRASTCEGAELTSVVCDVLLGPPRFAPGLTGPTPALSLRVLF